MQNEKKPDQKADVIEVVRSMIDEINSSNFFGSLTLEFHGGKLYLIRRTETIKL